MEPALVLVEREQAIATVTLNRPEVRNALNTPMLLELRAALEDIGRDDGVAVDTGRRRVRTLQTSKGEEQE
ncbi:MAG: enoyl-CoA hydratase-related protein [Dehalococcoidia bacterium]